MKVIRHEYKFMQLEFRFCPVVEESLDKSLRHSGGVEQRSSAPGLAGDEVSPEVMSSCGFQVPSAAKAAHIT